MELENKARIMEGRLNELLRVNKKYVEENEILKQNERIKNEMIRGLEEKLRCGNSNRSFLTRSVNNDADFVELKQHFIEIKTARDNLLKTLETDARRLSELGIEKQKLENKLR